MVAVLSPSPDFMKDVFVLIVIRVTAIPSVTQTQTVRAILSLYRWNNIAILLQLQNAHMAVINITAEVKEICSLTSNYIPMFIPDATLKKFGRTALNTNTYYYPNCFQIQIVTKYILFHINYNLRCIIWFLSLLCLCDLICTFGLVLAFDIAN